MSRERIEVMTLAEAEAAGLAGSIDEVETLLRTRFESHRDVVGALLRRVVKTKRGEEGINR